jgi:hypothetical protein
LTTSPVFASLLSDALMVPALMPVSVAISEAVLGPPLSAARIFFLFSPRGARAVVLVAGELSFGAGAVVGCVTGRWRRRLPSTRERTPPSSRLSAP